jgi:hypothetical protein
MRAATQSVVAMVTAVSLAGCAETAPQHQTMEGGCAEAYGANVCTWATLDGTGGLVEFGATIPISAVEQAPHEMEMVWPPVATAVVPLPGEVRAAMGLDHVTVYWEAHGHAPGPYLTPHFDFHFYNISAAAREAIDCGDETKPAALPASYALVDVDIPELGMLVGLCVPDMGMHALVASELERDEVFDGTMVIGYYHGAPIFVEPMIARDMLMRRQSFDLPMPAVSALPEGVRYPERFRAEYDAVSDGYRFIFSGM